MKLLLLNAPPLMQRGSVGSMYPPLGILYLASYAREKYTEMGRPFEVKVLDGNIDGPGDLLDEMHAFSPDVLGVSFGTQASTGAYQLINELRKERAGTAPFVVCGGPHSTALPDDVLRRCATDLVVLGEGELTLFEILRKVDEGDMDFSCVPGVGFLRGGEVVITPPRPPVEDLDSLPWPARDLIDLSRYPGSCYQKQRPETTMISSRGCPFNCTYCSNPVWTLSKPRFRLRDPEKVVDELEYIVNELGYREIFDQADEFSGSMKWAGAFCDAVIRRGVKASLKAQFRADRMNAELARKLEAAGFWLGLVGVESGNARTLAGVGKQVSSEMNTEALRAMKDAGLTTFALLMAFNVWEERGRLCYEDVADTLHTLEYARSLARQGLLDLMSWSLTTPNPGSELYEVALRHDLIPGEIRGSWEDWDCTERMVMRLPGISMRDWVRVQSHGKRLQAVLALRSGTFSLRLLPLYARRAISLVAKSLGVRSRLVEKTLEVLARVRSN